VQEPIFLAHRLHVVPSALVGGDEPFAVVRVQDPEPELTLVEPLAEGIAEHGLNLRADVDRDRVAGVVDDHAVEIRGDARDVLREGAELLLTRPDGLGVVSHPLVGDLGIVDGAHGIAPGGRTPRPALRRCHRSAPGAP
jgi:hypothetical protein